MRIGAHISVSGGYDKALDYALSVGCECVQVFAKSPRQWRAAPLAEEAAANARRALAAHGDLPLFTHTAYLINLATADAEMREKSVAALADELVRGGMLGAAGVVSHVGAAPDEDRSAVAARVASAIVEAYERAGSARGSARLLLENTAGAGSTFGANVTELCNVVAATGLDAASLGVCIDTCHGFAYGMALDTAGGWTVLLDEIESSIGLARLGLIHANDCKFERGSKKDRHEWIGDGHVGEAGFRAMLCEPRLAGVCAVTEMPGEVPEKDAVNIGRLSALRSECAPSQ